MPFGTSSGSLEVFVTISRRLSASGVAWRPSYGHRDGLHHQVLDRSEARADTSPEPGQGRAARLVPHSSS